MYIRLQKSLKKTQDIGYEINSKDKKGFCSRYKNQNTTFISIANLRKQLIHNICSESAKYKSHSVIQKFDQSLEITGRQRFIERLIQ